MHHRLKLAALCPAIKLLKGRTLRKKQWKQGTWMAMGGCSTNECQWGLEYNWETGEMSDEGGFSF
jgi:hypothetical protein